MNTTRKGCVLFTLLALSACAAPTGVDEANKAAQLMRDERQALADAPAKINAVVTALDDLVKEGGDMKAEFGAYSSSVDTVIAHRDRLRALATQIEQSRNEFAQHWQTRMQNIKDPDLRARADERRKAVVEEFSSVKETGEAAKKEFEPWLQTAIDVRSYLENDLNPTGVASIKDQARKIKSGAEDTNEAIGELVEKLDKIAASIAAAKPPEPEAEKKD